MADFSQTEINNTPNYITPKQGIVSEPTGLMGANKILGQVGALIEQGRTAKNEQLLADFTEEQLKIIDGVDQGAYSSSFGRTQIRQNLINMIDAHPGLRKELIAANGDVLGISGMGNVVTEGTREELLQQRLDEKLVLGGFASANATEEEMDMVRNNYLLYEEANRRHKMTMDTLAEERARAQGDEAALRLINEREQNEVTKYLNDVVPLSLNHFDNYVNEILEQSDLNDAQRLQLIEQKFSEMAAELLPFKSQVDSNQVRLIEDLFAQRRDIALKFIRGEYSEDAYKAAVRNNQATFGIAALNDPTIAAASAVTSLGLGDLLTNLAPEVRTSVANLVRQNAQETENPANIFSDTPEGRAALNRYFTSISQNFDSEDPEQVREQSNHLLNILSSVRHFESALRENPKAGIEIMDWMATPYFRDLMEKNPDLSDELTQARNILARNYSDEVWGLVRDEFLERQVVVTYGHSEFMESSNIDVTGLVTYEVSNAGIVFKPIDFENVSASDHSPQRARQIANELNGDVAPIINNLVKAGAHLEGRTDYENILNDILPKLMNENSEISGDGGDEGDEFSVEDFKRSRNRGRAGSNRLEGDMVHIANGIAFVESRGSGDYAAVGPVTRSGDRAYGRYQVMGNNIGPWTEQVLGRRLTKDEFMNGTTDMTYQEIQDAVFNGIFGGYIEKYGNVQDAASMWFSGRPLRRAGNASDGYMTVPNYVRKMERGIARSRSAASQ